MALPGNIYFKIDMAEASLADASTPIVLEDQSGNARNLVVNGFGQVRYNAWNKKKVLDLTAPSFLSLLGTFDRRNITVITVMKLQKPMCQGTLDNRYEGIWNASGSQPNVVSNSSVFKSITVYDGGPADNNLGAFGPDYDIVVVRGFSDKLVVTDIGGHNVRNTPLIAGTFNNIEFKNNSGNSFPATASFAGAYVWQQALSDAEVADAIAAISVNYPRVSQTWDGNQGQLMIGGTSVVAGFRTTDIQYTFDKQLAPEIVQCSLVAVSGSNLQWWTDRPARSDSFKPGTGPKVYFMDAPRNDVAPGSDAAAKVLLYFAYMGARAAAVPGLITVGSTMLPLNGVTTESNIFNSAIKAHYDPTPEYGTYAMKLKASSPYQGSAPAWLVDVASDATLLAGLTDGTHPTDISTPRYAADCKPLLLHLVGPYTPPAEGGGGGGGGGSIGRFIDGGLIR